LLSQQKVQRLFRKEVGMKLRSATHHHHHLLLKRGEKKNVKEKDLVK
jgi:hypothetical protein